MSERVVKRLSHHEQQKVCETRPPYRQGKKLTAVKIYTINDESQHLMICGVPQLQLRQEVKKLVFPYGMVKKVHVIPDYPTEEFTEAYHIHYEDIRSARIAKHFVDGKNFYGGILHVFYVPELESVTETRSKLLQRCKDVYGRLKRNKQELFNATINKLDYQQLYSEENTTGSQQCPSEQQDQNNFSATNGISVRDLQSSCTYDMALNWSSIYNNSLAVASTSSQLPIEITHDNSKVVNITASTLKQSDKCNKRKNYKGQTIRKHSKVKIIRPQIMDTSKFFNIDIAKKDTSFTIKKDNKIIVKQLPNNSKRRKITIKNPSIKSLIQPSHELQLSIQTAKSQIRAALENIEKG